MKQQNKVSLTFFESPHHGEFVAAFKQAGRVRVVKGDYVFNITTGLWGSHFEYGSDPSISVFEYSKTFNGLQQKLRRYFQKKSIIESEAL